MITLRQYWPLYLQAHRRPATRAVHYLATVFGAAMTLSAALTGQLWMVLLGIGGAYAMAIAAHWFLERNQPLILVNPLWGAICDLRMMGLALTGRLGRELATHGASSSASRSASVPSRPPSNTRARAGRAVRAVGRSSATRPRQAS